MSSSYSDLQPYWEAWKANSNRPDEDPEATHWEGMRKLFHAIATKTEPSEAALMNAYEYLQAVRPLWESDLKEKTVWDEATQSVLLHRGIPDEAAIRARCALKKEGAFFERSCDPICYTVDESVARGEAAKGRVPGVYYKFRVPLASVLYFDHEQHKVEGFLEAEKEVVCWHTALLRVGSEDVVDISVPNRKPLAANQAKKALLDRQIEGLKQLELKLMGTETQMSDQG